MTNTAPSLRARLIVIILIPLTLVSMVAGYWRVTSAAATAREIFDLNLQALTLAISRDVVVSGGDVISDKTRRFCKASLVRTFSITCMDLMASSSPGMLRRRSRRERSRSRTTFQSYFDPFIAANQSAFPACVNRQTLRVLAVLPQLPSGNLWLSGRIRGTSS